MLKNEHRIPKAYDALLYMLSRAKKLDYTRAENLLYLTYKQGNVDLGIKFDSISLHGPSSHEFGRMLIILRLARQIKEKTKPGRIVPKDEYKLSTLGKLTVNKVEISPETKKIIDELVERWKNVPHSDLISYTSQLFYE